MTEDRTDESKAKKVDRMKMKHIRILLFIGVISLLLLVVIPLGLQVAKYDTLRHKSNDQFSLADKNTTEISRQLQGILGDYKLVKPAQMVAQCSSFDPFNPYYTCYRGIAIVMQHNSNATSTLDATHDKLQNFMTAHNGTEWLGLGDLNSLKEDITQTGYWTSTYTLANTGVPGVPQADTTTATQTADLKIRMVIYNPEISRKQREEYRRDFPSQYAGEVDDIDYYSGVDTTKAETLLVVTFQKYDACSYDLLFCPGAISHFSQGKV